MELPEGIYINFLWLPDFLILFHYFQSPKEIDITQDLRLSPSIPTITKGFARVVLNMKWKSVAIVTSSKFAQINEWCLNLKICFNLGLIWELKFSRLREVWFVDITE